MQKCQPYDLLKKNILVYIRQNIIIMIITYHVYILIGTVL